MQTLARPSGNGRATSLLLAREGRAVVVADIDLARAQDTVQAILAEGGEAVAQVVTCSRDLRFARWWRQRCAVRADRHPPHNVWASLAIGDKPATNRPSRLDALVNVNLRCMWLTFQWRVRRCSSRAAARSSTISSMAARHAYPRVGYKSQRNGVSASRPARRRAREGHDPRQHDSPRPHGDTMAIEARVDSGQRARSHGGAKRAPSPSAGRWDSAGRRLRGSSCTRTSALHHRLALHVDGRHGGRPH